MNKIILSLIFVFIVLMGAASVSAHDVDNKINTTLIDTYIPISDVENSAVDDNVIEIENNLSLNLNNNNDGGEYNPNIDENDFHMISSISIIDKPLRLTDLNGLQICINEMPNESTLDLHSDIKNNGKENKIININKDMTIDGHGNTIDFGGRKNCYIGINAKNVILKNIKRNLIN